MKKKEYDLLFKLALSDLILVEKNINDDDISIEIKLFHLQQSIEKLLKCVLSYNKIIYPKTHRLDELIELSKEYNIKLPEYIDEFEILTMFAVDFRYDFMEDEIIDIHYYLNKVKDFVEYVRLKYNL